MNYKHGNWYCKPANEAEAKEIVERALASGAKMYEAVSATGGESDGRNKWYIWNLCSAWGVYNGRTYTSDTENSNDALNKATEYTIEQVRELFPLPGEIESASNFKIGDRVEIDLSDFISDRRDTGETATVLSVSVNSKGIQVAMIEIDGRNGECDAVDCRAIRPLRSERERWVEDAAIALHKDTVLTPEQSNYAAGAIYDAIKSGDLKAPEVE